MEYFNEPIYNNNGINNVENWFPDNSNYAYDQNTIRVLHASWKSLAKIGFLMSINEESGKPELSMVDETYILDPEIGGGEFGIDRGY